MSELKESSLAKAPPLFGRPDLIKIQTIKKKYLEQIRGYSEEEFMALLSEDFDPASGRRITDPWSTIRILGRDGYRVLFCYKRGPDPTMLFGFVPGVGYVDILNKMKYKAEGIEWPLDDNSRAKVEKIQKETWLLELERLPQIFEE